MASEPHFEPPAHPLPTPGETSGDPALRFRIGAMSRMTAIPVETLRVWERRHRAVVPTRTEGGFRLYSQEDLERLQMIKALVDLGETISRVANLSKDELRRRLVEHDRPTPVAMAPDRDRHRVVVVGPGLPMLLSERPLGDTELVGAFASLQALRQAPTPVQADLAVFECPTVTEDTLLEALDVLHAVQASQVTVVYQFGTEAAIRRLDTYRSVPLKGPLSVPQLALALRFTTARLDADEGLAPVQRFLEAASEEPRPPRFDTEAIARLIGRASSVQCECPGHMASLVQNLLAFEAYCRQCEHGSPKDAALHAALERATAASRATLENALEYLLRTESLEA